MAPGPEVAMQTPDLAGELGVAHRLEGGHLLVAGLDELGSGVGFHPGAEDPVDPIARVGKDSVDAPGPQSLQQITRYGLTHRSS